MQRCLRAPQTCLDPNLSGVFALGRKVSLAQVLSTKISVTKCTGDRARSGHFCQGSLSSEPVFEVSSQILCYLRQQNFGTHTAAKLEYPAKAYVR